MSKDTVSSFVISNIFSIIEHLFVRPNILWRDGQTFFSGVENYTPNNNRIQIFRYNHFSTSFFYTTVGSGTDTPDTFNHPQSWIWIENDYVYTGQSNPHNGAIDIWKSDVTDDVDGGFTELTQISNNNGYPKFYIDIDGKVAINIRTGSVAPNFNLAVNKSSGGIEGTWTLTQITANTENNYRFYNQCPIYYGTNTVRYFVGNRRNETTQDIFGQCFLKTTDNITFSNATETASKNVVSVAPFTNAEIDADYMINGSSASDTADLGYMTCICVDDVFYGCAIKSGTTDHYIFKIDGTTVTDTLIDIDDLTRGNGVHEIYMYYNGNNILISCIVDDTVTIRKEIWATPLDLSSFTLKYSYEVSTSVDEPIAMSENIDQVIGEHMMHLKISGTSAFFYLTTDKFFI